jgi:hypothetical protein
MSPEIEITGGAGPMETAAILAAVARLVEEEAAALAAPPERPGRGLWVLSGRPRPVQPPFAARPTPAAPGWSVGSEEAEA